MTETISFIPSRVKNCAEGGHVAGARDIIDDGSGITLDELVGNKEYASADFSGMGRVVFKKNIVNGVNTLTQEMMSDANTIYVIQYDFAIEGTPENISLNFTSSNVSGVMTPEKKELDGATAAYNDNPTEANLARKNKAQAAYEAIGRQDYYYWVAVQMQAHHALHLTGRAIRLNESKSEEIDTDGGIIFAYTDTTVYIGCLAGSYGYVYDGFITIPQNCVLYFDGGSINGGTVIGQGTYIGGNDINIINQDITLYGDWNFNSISPDWFRGTDVQKVQKAVDVAIAHRSVQVDINRTYNLTGGTVYIERGVHSEDEISPYSRRDFIISGSGEGRFIKEDAGFMFSAHSGSIDIEFSKIHFRGYLTDPTDLSTIVDMKVFDCRYLYNIRVSNCTFCHCGCVYHQTGDVSIPMTGTLSLNNQYTKNKYVLQANECWHSQFVCDTIEDGFSVVEMEGEGSNLRDFKIINCCIEGFYLNDSIALNFKGNLNGCSITDNYFEANYCSMKAVHALSGVITGNSFHSRGPRIDATKEIHCIELANCGGNIVITGNTVVSSDANMYMFWFDTTSPFYVTSQLLVGENDAAGNTNISNVPDKIVTLSSFIRDNNVKYTNDIINVVKQSFPQITDGHVYLTRVGKQVTIGVSVTTNAAITSGSVTNYQDTCKPVNNGGYGQILIDSNTGNFGQLIINVSGTLYIKVPDAGTYSGLLSYIHY